MLARWYISLPGLVLSLAVAAAAYVVLPPRYTSATTMVLVQPSRSGQNSVLTFDGSLNVAAMLLVQALNDPQLPSELGLTGKDTFTVTNGSLGTNGKAVVAAGPFITVTAESSSTTEPSAIVGSVAAKAQQELTDLQSSSKVSARNSMTVRTIIEPTPAKRVWDTLLRTMGLAALLGVLLTLALVCLVDRAALRARARAAQKSASEDVTQPERNDVIDNRPAPNGSDGIPTRDPFTDVRPLTAK